MDTNYLAEDLEELYEAYREWEEDVKELLRLEDKWA